MAFHHSIDAERKCVRLVLNGEVGAQDIAGALQAMLDDSGYDSSMHRVWDVREIRSFVVAPEDVLYLRRLLQDVSEVLANADLAILGAAGDVELIARLFQGYFPGKLMTFLASEEEVEAWLVERTVAP